MCGKSSTAIRIAMTAGMLALAGCATSSHPPFPRPTRPAVNPFQAEVTGHAYALTLSDGHGGKTASAATAGSARIVITAARDQVCWTITRLSGVPGPLYAYIHRGQADVAGPVILSLGTGYQPAGCVTGVAPALLAAIETRPAGYYLAIHTVARAAGAVRGQL